MSEENGNTAGGGSGFGRRDFLGAAGLGVGGAAAGTVIQATLGNHNGYQYIVKINSCGESSLECENNQDKAFVQGDNDPIPNGQKVVIIYGKDVRIMPYED